MKIVTKKVINRIIGKTEQTRQIILVIIFMMIIGNISLEKAQSAGSGRCWVESVDCIESGEKKINGFKEKRDCWRRKKMYKCEGYADKAKSCDKLSQNNNCIIEEEPECKEKHNGWCVNEEIKYGCSKESKIKRIEKRIRVPTFKKEDNEEMRRSVKCNEAIKCIDGKCFDITYKPSEDMGKAAGILGALKHMKYDQDSLSIWKGEPKKCGLKSFGAVKCCVSGRGKNILEKLKFSTCSAEEKELAEIIIEDEERCHLVGTYRKKLFGLIGGWKKFKSYCCFDNRLAKEVNKQAREKGLIKRGWGEPESPDCRGFTTDELQNMDWDKLKFEFLETEIMEKMADKKMGSMANAMGHARRMVVDETDVIKEAVKGASEKNEEDKIYEGGKESEDIADQIDEGKLWDEMLDRDDPGVNFQKRPYGRNEKRDIEEVKSDTKEGNMNYEDKECGGHARDPNCSILSEQCIEGAATKNIKIAGGKFKEVHKDCWRWKAEYSCNGASGSYKFTNYCQYKESNIKHKKGL